MKRKVILKILQCLLKILFDCRKVVFNGLVSGDTRTYIRRVRVHIPTMEGRPKTWPSLSKDHIFLQALLQEIQRKKKIKSPHDHLYLAKPVCSSALAFAKDLSVLCESSTSAYAQYLGDLLQAPHLLGLLKAQDTVASNYSSIGSRSFSSGYSNSVFMPEEEYGYEYEAIRMVGIRKTPEEPLGLTVRHEEETGHLIIARVMAGGAIDRQGLLRVGDAIVEVNGVEVTTLEELHAEIAKCQDSVTLKVLPAIKDKSTGNQVTSLHPDASRTICYMRALYSYDPTKDTLLPTCPEQENPEKIGLAFEKGDILQVVDQSDPNWWQAQLVHAENPRTGLIPSQTLEERRKAFVRQEYDFVHKIGICGTMISKRKRKIKFSTRQSNDYDKAELLLYEEVARMPPFMRKTLVLVGSHGVGRRTLKARILGSDPERFGSIVPHTSRPMRELEEDGKAYHFTTREAMEADIKSHKYLEYGEFHGNLYGTKLDSILSVIRSGKMCVLDCSPTSLKFLRNSPDFLPYVIFLAASGMDEMRSFHNANMGSSRHNIASSRQSLTFDRYSSARYSSRRARTLESLASLYEEEDFKRAIEESARIERVYEKYFDTVIINNDLYDTYNQIMECLEKLATEPQWVPVTWVY